MSPSGQPGRRRPPRIPAALVSARIRGICSDLGTLDYLDIQRIHPLHIYDIRLPNGNHLRMDWYVQWADVHNRHGRRVLGLGSILCHPARIVEVIVPSVVAYCGADVARPIEPGECAPVTPDEYYLLSDEEREWLEGGAESDS